LASNLLLSYLINPIFPLPLSSSPSIKPSEGASAMLYESWFFDNWKGLVREENEIIAVTRLLIDVEIKPSAIKSYIKMLAFFCIN